MGLYRCKKCKTKKEFLKTTLIFFENNETMKYSRDIVGDKYNLILSNNL